MINGASVYELTVLYCKSPLTYPEPVEREPLGFFTTIERTEEFLRNGVERGQVGWFEIEADCIVLGYQLAGKRAHTAEGSLCAPMATVDEALVQALHARLTPTPNNI